MKLKLYNDTFEVRIKALFKSFMAWMFGLSSTELVKPFKSLHYELEFRRFSDYWIEVGKRSALIDLLAKRAIGTQGPIGYRNEEVFTKFTRVLMGPHPCVLLYDVDHENIGKVYDRFPGLDKSLFIEDVIVLPAKNKEAARKLVNSFPSTLVRSIGFSDGEIFCCNYPY